MSKRVTVKQLEGRERELIVAAGNAVAQAKEQVNQVMAQYVAAEQQFNALIEIATGEEPKGLTLDVDTGEVYREASKK